MLNKFRSSGDLNFQAVSDTLKMLVDSATSILGIRRNTLGREIVFTAVALFEDALGRRFSLEMEWIHRWEVCKFSST